MYRSVFLVLVVIAGCAALGAAPWVPALSEHNVILESLDNYAQVPTRHHDLRHTPRGDVVEFLIRPNAFQTCGCVVQREITVCVCNQPEFGLCAEFEL